MMNHKEKLIEIYKQSFSVSDIKDIDKEIRKYISTIGNNISSQKGVYTVLVTLLTHKTLFPKQDIRYHQSSLENGFSGRTIDTQYITPTLKELGLTSMAESGWLTRSLEQAAPYTLDYKGKISNKNVKEAFLKIIDFIEKHPNSSSKILRLILKEAIKVKKNSNISFVPLIEKDKITIDKIANILLNHFEFKYKESGASKLPVLAFYSLYKCLIKEIERYKSCKLKILGSHHSSDKSSKSAGDLEIFKDNNLFETIEIKYDKFIDLHILRIAIEKIKIHNPQRYYILSVVGIKSGEEKEIQIMVDSVKEIHGCQIIINGLLPTIKYYLRLISDLDLFIVNYNELVLKDSELKNNHKRKWIELIQPLTIS